MMKGRLKTLLELFELEQCENGDFIDQKVDFEYVDRVLKTEQERGKQYLYKELMKKQENMLQGNE